MLVRADKRISQNAVTYSIQQIIFVSQNFLYFFSFYFGQNIIQYKNKPKISQQTILTVSDTYSFWHLQFLTLTVSDTYSFWHWQFLTLTVSDTYSFWHLQFLTLTVSDTYSFWHLHQVGEIPENHLSLWSSKVVPQQRSVLQRPILPMKYYKLVAQ